MFKAADERAVTTGYLKRLRGNQRGEVLSIRTAIAGQLGLRSTSSYQGIQKVARNYHYILESLLMALAT